MDSPSDMQAEKERIFQINFFIFFFYWRRNSSNERGSQWGDGLYHEGPSLAALSPARVAQRVSMGRWLLRLTVRIVAIVRLPRAIFVLEILFLTVNIVYD